MIKTCRALIAKYGVPHQFSKMIEEFNELKCAYLMKDRQNIIEEIIDCDIMIEQYFLIRFDLKNKYEIAADELEAQKQKQLKRINEVYLNDQA